MNAKLMPQQTRAYSLGRHCANLWLWSWLPFASDSDSGARVALNIQGVVFFRAGQVPVGVGDFKGQGG